mgnify:CR=1 FL=1|jgi:hypothetical protein
MKALAAALISTLITTLSLAAQAQTNTPRVDQRQANQERRIDQGVAAGSLSASEAARLERQQDRVDHMENRAKSDGQVTRRERAKLHAAQDHSSRTIARKKHNGRE